MGISGLTHTSSEEIKSKLSHEWREAIEKLRIKVRENRTPEAFVYMKLLEDSTLFWSLSDQSVEYLKNILKNPSLLKSTLSGESTFNWQRVVDMSPYEQVVPSDLGMPIFTEMRTPIVASVRGRFSSDIMRSSEGLSKVDATFEVLVDRRVTGRVGTIIPFTGEYVYTGIDEKIYGGGPSMDINVRLDIPNGKLSASLKFPEQKWNKGRVEFIAYKVRPYTVIQKYFDMTPVFKSAGFKIINSRTPMHTKEYEFGQYSGIDMKLVYNTQTPYLGYNYLLKKLSNMNYNPINMFRFTGVDALSLTATGIPSVRHHESKLVVLPQSSSTKEVEFVLKWGVASKEKGQPMLYHIMKPSENTLFKIVSKPVGEMREQPRRQEMVKSMMEKLQITSEGKAITFSVSTILKGNRPRTFSYSGTVGTGQSGLTSKWDLELRCERTSRKICVRGDISIPPFSIWNLNSILSEDPVFRFRNTLGYGRECESKVVIYGYAKTSESQKHLARETPEAKEFEHLLSKGTPMVELSKLAEIVRRQSTVLDVYDYKISYVNVGRQVSRVSRKVLDALELVLLPYHVSKDSYSSSGVSRLPISSIGVGSAGFGYGSENWEMEVRTTLHHIRSSIVVEITNVTRPGQEYKFRDIPLPYPLTYLYPKTLVSYVTNPLAMTVKAITGKPIYPVCTLEGKHITTFDNRTTKANMDDCFHLLSGDCSKAMSYGVLVRPLESSSSYSHESKKEVKVFIGKTEFTMKPEGEDVAVKVNGSPIRMMTEKKTIKGVAGHIDAKISMSKDKVVILESSKINVLFDGKRIKVEGSNLLKNKLCGLCGDSNNKMVGDVPSPRQCLLSSPKLEVASYRVSLPSKQCSPLPGNLMAELKKETEIEMCIKLSNLPNGGISASSSLGYESLSGMGGSGCMEHRHEMHELVSENNKLCFSMIPLLTCKRQCHSVGMREKRIGFTCMPEYDRKTQHIAEKVRRGETVPELRNLSTTFTKMRSMPVDCKPNTAYGSSLI